jgi:hypothetical protein
MFILVTDKKAIRLVADLVQQKLYVCGFQWVIQPQFFVATPPIRL